MDKNVEIVSLGVNCLPRTVLTRGGIKPGKAQGELSCPFDLVYHQLSNITHYLETEFSDYFSDIYFETKEQLFAKLLKKGIWVKSDGTMFYHDKDCKINDKKKLTTRIQNRINNFYRIINSQTPILFVLNIIEEGGCVEELLKILDKLCSHKKYKLAILDFYNLAQCDDSKVEILRMAEPTYRFSQNWNKKKYRDSKLGKYVEKCICEFIQRIIEKDFS